ncbi:Hypothetical predicted protein [Pelobates cultripes]|uniref:Uncharacterized protein n=1 Tax=Pelobates cultripes TaxID=61616 RepID=A0AAD1WAU5_PELCU|nr:Hypothetical predicted protein [Pelobates cultripes]
MSPVPSNVSESQLPQEGEWKAILPNLLTKADFEALSDRLGRVVREEVAQLRADLANMEARMSVAESETRSLRTDLEQTNLAVANQEADTANLTTWIDDLDNRGRRLNLRIRGMREGGPTEHVPDALLHLFTQDHNYHAGQTKVPKDPSNNAAGTGIRARQGASRSTNGLSLGEAGLMSRGPACSREEWTKP